MIKNVHVLTYFYFSIPSLIMIECDIEYSYCQVKYLQGHMYNERGRYMYEYCKLLYFCQLPIFQQNCEKKAISSVCKFVISRLPEFYFLL